MRKAVVLCAVVLLTVGCNRNKKESKEGVPSLDLVMAVKQPPPNHFLHKTLTLRNSETFEIEVPTHCLYPRLKGSFASYRQSSEGRTSDEAASIDVLLMDEDEHEAFLRGPGGEVTRSVSSSYGQTVDWALRSTTDEPRKYYLVFLNSSEKPKTKFVEADFTVSFE
jgi:hypothetical protein